MKRLVISFFLIMTSFLFFIFLYNKNKLKEYSKTYSDFNGINLRVYTSNKPNKLFDELEYILKHYDENELYNFGLDVINKTDGYVSIYRKSINDAFEEGMIKKIKPVYKDTKEIDYSSIIKSFIISKLEQKIKDYNISSYIINMGDVSSLGSANNTKFTVGIEKPYKTDEYITFLKLSNKAVSTVGPYQNYYTFDSKIYHNLINLKTLKQENNYKSVTVIGDNVLDVQMLSNYLYFLSIEDGKKILKKYNCDAIWYTNDDELIFTKDFTE